MPNPDAPSDPRAAQQWPLQDMIALLASVAEYCLDEHNYDRDGYEAVRPAIAAVTAYQNSLASSLPAERLEAAKAAARLYIHDKDCGTDDHTWDEITPRERASWPWHLIDWGIEAAAPFLTADAEGLDWKAHAIMLAEALRLTQEYIGDEVLPPLPNWDWFDALEAHKEIMRPAAPTAPPEEGAE